MHCSATLIVHDLYAHTLSWLKRVIIFFFIQPAYHVSVSGGAS